MLLFMILIIEDVMSFLSLLKLHFNFLYLIIFFQNQRRVELQIAAELKKPIEDMEIKDIKVIYLNTFFAAPILTLP